MCYAIFTVTLITCTTVRVEKSFFVNDEVTFISRLHNFLELEPDLEASIAVDTPLSRLYAYDESTHLALV